MLDSGHWKRVEREKRERFLILDTGHWMLEKSERRERGGPGSGLNIQQIVLEPGRTEAAKTKELKYAARVVVGEVAEDFFNRGLCLPSDTAMTDSDLDRILSAIRRSHK